MKYLRLFITSAAAILVILLAFGLKDTHQSAIESKIDGVSFVAPARPVDIEAMKSIKSVNANWVAIIPYAFSRAGSPKLLYNLKRQWWGERLKGVAKTIKYARQLGLKVMLKPQVWVRGPGWTGNFELSNETAWKQWQSNYSDYIITFAKVADSLEVELFCIGTEYRKSASAHPDFWRGLIEEVRTFYGGKLTYAANWDNYEDVSFWDKLDYIGIDAYFPLSEKRNPSAVHLKTQWQSVKQVLRRFSERYGKPILFTEFGYKSVDFTADAHWKYERDVRELNLQAQANAYRALFETFWDEPWFAGSFLWKWYPPEMLKQASNKGYTPQNKPAEQVIRRWYGR